MPPGGYRPPPRLFIDSERCVVRVVAERDGKTRDFDFSILPVHQDVQGALARAFHVHTGPSGAIKALPSAKSLWVYVRAFARVLAVLPTPPRSASDLTPSHLDQFVLSRAANASVHTELSSLIALLARIEGLSPALAARCALGHPKRPGRTSSSKSYTPSEDARIGDAARETVREAADRIRGHHDLLRRWREGDAELVSDSHRNRYLEIVDSIERAAEVPRYDNGKTADWLSKTYGSVDDLMLTVHLNSREVAAFTVLLVRLTGQNGDTILNAPAVHHRPDGSAGPIASVQVDLVKPRRGRRSYMTAAFSDLPTWATPPYSDAQMRPRDELHTPYGIYMLARELTESARRITGSDKLFHYWSTYRWRGFRVGVPEGRSIAPEWGREQALLADPTGPGPAQVLKVRLGNLRRTHVAREQKPVAHTTHTLSDTYLRRDRTTVQEYQQLVAEVLTKETEKARSLGTIAQLSAADLTEAQRNPAMVADRFGVSEEMLRLLVARDADTVLAGCSDNLNSPHSTRGQPCTASFLKCLDCPCARALPHHLPIQVAARDLLEQKRSEMTALRWAQHFSYPMSQLDNLLDHAGAAVEQAQQNITDADRALVARLLNREFDHP